uniref:histidine kinase dimerization/phospho-acceptor domain-containing protein n=1 Tax=Pseudomonas sp. TaxID=306 RepID=UPI00262129D0
MDSRQRELASALVERIEIGVIILDAELRIQHWNSFVSQCSGKALERSRKQPLTLIFPEADTPCLSKMLVSARDHGEHVYTEWHAPPYLIHLPFDMSGEPAPLTPQTTLLFPFKRSDDQPLLGLLLYDSSALARDNKQLDAALHTLSNKQVEQELLITKLGQANAQLMQSEKLAAIGQLAAGVAHEINNPIGYVFSNLQTLAGYVHDLLRIIDAVDGAVSLEELRQLKRSLEYDYIRSDVEALIGESEDGIERVKKIITAHKDFSHIEEDEFRFADLHRGLDTTLNVVNNELKYKAEVVKDYGQLP